MNPQASVSGSGLSQPGSDMGQLPPIHAPDTFRAPDAVVPHFAPAPVIGMSASPASGIQPVQAPVAPPPQPSINGGVPLDAAAAASTQAQILAQNAPTAPAEEPDTAFDEEWVGKARQVVTQLHADPFLQSKELHKLKAQYIKARYNKDIKVSEG